MTTVCSPSTPSEVDIFKGWGDNLMPCLNRSLFEYPYLLQQPWLHAPIIAHLLLCVLSLMTGDANCFRLVGSDICCPWVVQKRHRYISSQFKIFCSPCELHWLLFIHPLYSLQGTIFNMLLSLLPLPN